MADDEFRFRRIRSISVSTECSHEKGPSYEPSLDAASVAEWVPSLSNGPSKSLTLNSRTSSFGILAKEHKGLGSRLNDLINFMKSKYFTTSYFKLQSLPDHIKVHIFSFLGQKTLGRLMLVCKEWNKLMRSPSLWSRLDFCHLRMCSHIATQDCITTCYPLYRSRVKLYSEFIRGIKFSPKYSIQFLRFSFDIGDYEDGWKDMVLLMMDPVRLRGLKWAEINWKVTKEKPATIHNNTSATWSDSELRNFSINRKFRQRTFSRLFDVFTAIVPHLQHLRLPFDWFDPNIQVLSRLESLQSLQLDLYFAYFHVSQEKLSSLFSLLPHLRELTLEFYQESDLGYHQYSLDHPNLTLFDVSQCKGVYISHMNVPSLQVFRTSRSPKKWVFVYDEPSLISLPCLHHVLSSGTPSLTTLNNHHLQDGWLCDTYDDLEKVLLVICPCSKHCPTVTV